MSRGLGNLERRILAALRDKDNSRCDFNALVWWAAGKLPHPGADYPDEIAFLRPYRAFPDVYKSVYRAVKSLERKGLVRVARRKPRGSCRDGRLCPIYDRGLGYPYMVVELAEAAPGAQNEHRAKGQAALGQNECL